MTDVPATADVQTNVSAGTSVSVSPSESVPVRDRLTVRIVVIALAIYALAVLLATVVLVLQDKRLPEALETTGAVALGGLGTMLVSTSSAPDYRGGRDRGNIDLVTIAAVIVIVCGIIWLARVL